MAIEHRKSAINMTYVMCHDPRLVQGMYVSTFYKLPNGVANSDDTLMMELIANNVLGQINKEH